MSASILIASLSPFSWRSLFREIVYHLVESPLHQFYWLFQPLHLTNKRQQLLLRDYDGFFLQLLWRVQWYPVHFLPEILLLFFGKKFARSHSCPRFIL